MTRILIVEDSATQAERLRAVLEEAGFEVLVAYDAETALTRLDSSLDLVISDIVMPGISGYDLCKRIKSGIYGRNLPVMLLSTLSDPMDIISGLECGADNFITKPYQPAQLLERVTTVLESRRMRASGKLRVGVEVIFLGRSFTINSDKEQIVDLLMATFEDIVRTNRELHRNRAELAVAKLEIEDYAQSLERRVEERTRELATQSRLLAQAQSMAQVGNWRVKIGSENHDWSDQMYEIHGVSRGFIPNNSSFAEMIHPEDRAEIVAKLKEVRDTHTPRRVDYRVVRPNGEVRFCWGEGFFESGEDGDALVGYCQDITERKLNELAAQESAARYRHIVDAMSNGLFVLQGGRFAYLNNAACRIFGVTSADALLNTAFVDAITGENRHRLAAMLGNETAPDVASQEEKFLRPDGTELDVEISTAKLTFAGKPATQVILRDITERNAIAQQLHQAQKMDVVGQLTGGIAHDFNNMLTVVISNLDLLLGDGGAVKGETRELADAALAASLRGAELTRQLLAFSRKQNLERRVLDPNALVERTVAMLRRAIAGDIELKTRLGEDVWQAVSDPSQLESAITNLVVNARDAMPKGGAIVVETANVTLDAAYAAANAEVVPGDYAMIAVSDSGNGIPAALRAKVFEPFFTTKEVGKGTGLGLSMVYGFMKQSGGHVKIYSEEGQGTVVRLYLPRSGEEAGQAHKAEPAALTHAGDARILVVEDDEAVRHAASQQLRELGYTVLEAANANEALTLLDTEAVDLLFSDVTMPGGLSGHDLASIATQKHPALRVLMTSGFTEPTLYKGAASGRFELLGKPYRRQELAERIYHTLQGRTARGQAR